MPLRRLTAAVCLSLLFFIPAPSFAESALRAPSWMPGQPVLVGDKVVAQWLPVPGAVIYNIFLDGQKIAEQESNQYIGPAPKTAGLHVYEIAAVDEADNESPRSIPGRITITILKAPTGLLIRAYNDDKQIGIRWTHPRGSVLTNIYRAESKEGPYQLLDSVQGTNNYKDDTVKYGHEYWYVVTAKDVAGRESPRSETVNAKIIRTPKSIFPRKPIPLVLVTSREVERLTHLGGVPVPDIRNIKKTGNGYLWITTGFDGRVVAIDTSSRKVIWAFDLKEILGDLGIPFRHASDLDVREGEYFVVTDSFTGQIVCLDMQGRLKWRTAPSLPPKDRSDLWKFLPEEISSVSLKPLHPVLLTDGNLWVSESKGSLIYILDPRDGRIKNWMTYYDVSEYWGNQLELPGISFLEEVKPGIVAMGSPFNGQVVLLGSESFEALGSIGIVRYDTTGRLGRPFHIEMVGADAALISDSSFGTLQGFRFKEGTYLYHIIDESLSYLVEKTRLQDSKDYRGGILVYLDPSRRALNLQSVGLFSLDKQGRLWLFDSVAGIISVREVDWPTAEEVGSSLTDGQ